MIETVTFGFEIGGVQTDSCVDMDNLHANDGVDEEEHCQEEADVGQRLERLHEGPQQDANRVALPQQFNEAGRAEKAKKADVYESNIVECFLPKKVVSLYFL